MEEVVEGVVEVAVEEVVVVVTKPTTSSSNPALPPRS